MSDNFICDLYICCAGKLHNKSIYEKSSALFNFLTERGINCRSNFNNLVHDKNMVEIASKSRLFLLLTDGEIKTDSVGAILKTASVYALVNAFYQRFFNGANFGYAKVFCLNECVLPPERLHVIFQNTNHFSEKDAFEVVFNWVNDIITKDNQKIKKNNPTAVNNNILTKKVNKNQVLKDNNSFVIEKGKLIKYFGNENAVFIPEGVKEIGARAFYNNSELVFAYLPNTVENIGEYAFANCKSLVDINFPTSLKSIARGAFSGDESIKMINFNKTLETIGENAFWGCSSVYPVQIPLSVKNIGSGAFDGIKNLIVRCEHTFEPMGFEEGWEGMGDPFWLAKDAKNTNYDHSDSWIAKVMSTPLKPLKSRGKDGMNYYCDDFHVLNGELVYVGREMQRFEIPSGTKSIAPHVFCDRSELKEVIFPKTLVKICAGAFAKTGIENLVIPPNVKVIEEYAFADCKNLKSVKFSKGVQVLKNNLFANCYNLTEINIPVSVENVENSVFQGCENLSEIKIPASVKQIGERVFLGVKNCTITLSKEANPACALGWNANCKVIKK